MLSMANFVLLASAGSLTSWVLIALVLILAVVIFYCRQQSLKYRNESRFMREALNSCKTKLEKIDELEKLIPELQKIAKLDHDVNTPLCVITMSLGRAKRLGQENNDESLLNNVQDILNSVGRIQEIMQAVRILKTNPLVAYKIKGVPAKDMGH